MLHLSLWFQSVLSDGLGGLGGGPNDKGEGGKDCGKGKHKHHKKMMQCMKQTKDLHESCCPFPVDDDAMETPECKEHLEGIEQKEGKEKHKAMKCWIDCMFKTKKLIEGKELKKDKIIQSFDDMLTKLDGEDFKEISVESIEFCHTECKFSTS